MDPLSITASVVGLTATCFQTAKALNDLKSKFQSASLTAAAICTEATIISASLSQIQSSMLGSPDGLSEKLRARPDLEATLEIVLTGCYVVFDVLQTEIQKLTGSAQPNPSDLGFRAKLRYVWSESTMQDILSQIRGLQTALALFLQLLGTDTMADLKQMLDNNTVVLSQVVQRFSHFRTARTSRAPQSIFEMSFATQSIHSGDGSSVISSACFSFDNEIVNAQAYRRVLAKAFASSNDVNQTQSAGINHGADPAADRVLPSARQLLNPENPQLGSTLDPTNSELDTEVMRLSEETQLLKVSDPLILSPTPSDSQMAFLSGKETPVDDWVTRWSIKGEDIEHVSQIEVDRQEIIHEFINTESHYLRSLQVLRYFYKVRIDPSYKSLSDRESFAIPNFPECENIYDANKTLLYDPLKSRQLSEGPWVSEFWDIFQNWLSQSGDFYIEHASVYPVVKVYMKTKAGYSIVLDKYLNDPLSGGLTWHTYLRSPLERVQRYLKLLGSILKRSDKSNPTHKFGELEKLTENMRVFGARCEVAVRQSFEKAEIDDLRSRMGDAGQRILPVGVEILHSQEMRYMGWWNFYSVTVLEIRKPDRVVIVLKHVPSSKAGNKSTLAVVAEFRGNVRTAWYSAIVSRRDKKRICFVRISADNAGAREKPIKLAIWHRAEAHEYLEALSYINGTPLKRHGRECWCS